MTSSFSAQQSVKHPLKLNVCTADDLQAAPEGAAAGFDYGADNQDTQPYGEDQAMVDRHEEAEADDFEFKSEAVKEEEQQPQPPQQPSPAQGRPPARSTPQATPTPDGQPQPSPSSSLPQPSAEAVELAKDSGSSVYIANLTWWTTDADVEGVCSQFGRLKGLKFMEERSNCKSKGVAQVRA